MSQFVAGTICFHCSGDIDVEGLAVDIGGTTYRFCSEACLAAARRIHQLELGDFYEYRQRFAPAPAVEGEQAIAVARKDRSGDDRLLEFESCIQPLRDGRRMSVRVPDIRCAACTWLIENSLRQRSDVSGCQTNLADRRVTIDFDGARPMDLVTFIEELGFTVLPDRTSDAKRALDKERKTMLARLGVAGIGMMQVMMYALASYLAGDNGIEPAYESLMHWASLAVTTPIVLYSAAPFFRGASRDLRGGHLGMDVPIALAIAAAFALSTMHTLAGRGEVYFDSVCMFTFLLLIGRYIELGSRDRYQQSRMLSDSLLPASALLAAGEERIPVANLVAGDEVLVGPGESIPADGIIIKGNTSVVEAAFTGESMPVAKTAGSRVLAGSDNLDGEIRIRATAGFRDFVITRISELYRESSAYKPRFSIMADVVARYFVAVILILASASAAWWYLAGSTDWFSIGLAVLVVSCPCALSLATPVAYTVAVAAMRNSGIVIGNGTFLERLANVSRVVFDKTGTLTQGKPRLGSIVTLSTMTRNRALDIAAALEEHSKHPIALAFEGVSSACARGVRVAPGEGVCGEVDGVTYRLGRPSYAAGGALCPPEREGSWVLLAGEEPLAWFCLEDTVREEAAGVVASLARDHEISMFTGDVSGEGKRLGELLGIDDVATDLTPESKLARIRALQDDGERVLMIGDGVNDAAAMAAASASIAVSPADVVVQEAADATLLAADLQRVPLALEFAAKVRRVIRQNIAWAVCYNLFVIPLAVTGFIVPWMAALGMSASSILVVLNANRLYKVK